MAKFNPATARQNWDDSFERIEKPVPTIPGKSLAQQLQQASDSQKTKIAQQLAEDRAQSQKRITELEAEIRKLRLLREEQLRQRREPSQPTPEQLAAQQESPLVVSTKKRRGFFGNWGRRVKTAQEQFQPETVGRRIGG